MTSLDRTTPSVADHAAPGWFRAACRRPSVDRRLVVGGASVSYRLWGDPVRAGEPPIVLVHGTSAHKEWWTHIAGLLCDDRAVAAIDLSGHGDSDERPHYDLGTWADELIALIDDLSGDEPALVVGHSLGGVVAATAAVRTDAPVAAVALCETIRDPRETRHPVMTARPRQHFPALDDALARFGSIATRSVDAPFVLDRIARRSVRRAGDGWTWKHDPVVPSQLQPVIPPLDELVPRAICPVTVIRAEHGLVTPDDVERLVAVGAPRGLDVVELAQSGHHPMLDVPRHLVGALRSWARRFNRLVTTE